MLGILNDIRVLELSNTVGGAFAAKLLADQGARVIKMEKPLEGDQSRHEPPFLGGDPDPEKSSLFLALNTNKRGITLNLESASGRQLLLRLVKDADLVIESFTPSYLDNLGVGFEAMLKVNPRVVLTSVTYFGQTGPYSQYHGDDLICQAMGGFLYGVTGFNDRAPMGTALYQMELTSGRNAANASMVALMQQKQGGLGQHVDVSVYESSVSVPGGAMYPYSFNGAVSRRPAADTAVLDGMHLKTKDGEATLTTAGTGGKPMETWAELLGAPALLDPRFKTRDARRTLWKEQFDVVQEKLLQWTNDDLMRETMARGLVIGLVLSTFQVVESEHLKARKFWVEIDHPVAGKFKYPGPGFLMDGANPLAGSMPAPLLGQHNVAVFCDQLGITKEDLGILVASGAV